MIDVLLTILIFFMTITSAQVLKVDKTINLPIAKDAQKKDNSRAEGLVNVRWKGINERVSFSTSGFFSRLRPWLNRSSWPR